jgi:glycine cleavage system H protein
MKVGDFEIKENLYYSETHEWFKVEGNKITMGIDDVAQQQMGEITFVDFRGANAAIEVGTELGSSDKIAEIESHKAVEDVFTHVSGKVTETNAELANFPAQINEDPYGKGWMIKVEAKSPKDELAKLMSAEKYAEFIKSQNNL